MSHSKKKKKLSMRSILFCSLALLSLCSIFMVWIVLRQFLHIFFYNAQVSEYEKVVLSLKECTDKDTLQKKSYDMSFDSNICIRIFEIGCTSNEIISSEVQADCFIHHIPNEECEEYFKDATESGGTVVYEKSIRDILSGDVNQLKSSSENIVYCTILNTPFGNYFVMLDSRLPSEDFLNSVVINQVIIITVCVLALTMIVAFTLAKLLTSPLKNMTNSAKQLALGNYDVDFSGGNYKETDELSNTLAFAAKELKKNDELQKEIIANVSHDLRTPLTLIRGYAEVMHDIPDENTPENIQIIIDETTHLSQLVSDMLDLSRISSGGIEPSREVFDLTQNIEQTIRRYSKFTDQNGFTINFEKHSHVFVYADKSMIMQVVYNFINNAINYSENTKEITVTQEVCDGEVTIYVTDRGRGIPDDKLQYIWDRYYKLDKNHKIPSVGSGLGLSIAKQILISHSAPFGVSSKLGEGSTFWFTLKIAYHSEG